MDIWSYLIGHSLFHNKQREKSKRRKKKKKFTESRMKEKKKRAVVVLGGFSDLSQEGFVSRVLLVLLPRWRLLLRRLLQAADAGLHGHGGRSRPASGRVNAAHRAAGVGLVAPRGVVSILDAHLDGGGRRGAQRTVSGGSRRQARM